jgi:hypothetical protein
MRLLASMKAVNSSAMISARWSALTFDCRQNIADDAEYDDGDQDDGRDVHIRVPFAR